MRCRLLGVAGRGHVWRRGGAAARGPGPGRAEPAGGPGRARAGLCRGARVPPGPLVVRVPPGPLVVRPAPELHADLCTFRQGSKCSLWLSVLLMFNFEGVGK